MAVAGDLCVWPTHIGIALGGSQMISALNPSLGTLVTPISGQVERAADRPPGCQRRPRRSAVARGRSGGWLMALSGVSGTAVAATASGLLLIWSGVKGTRVTDTLRSALSGHQPAGADAYPITADTGGSLNSGTVQTASGPGVANPKSGTWTHAGLASLWQQAGGSAAAADNAACHAIQESSGNASVTSPNPDGGTNVGLWQLDTKGKGAGYTVAQLQDPMTNARLAVMGSRNGADWSAWATPGC